MMSGELFRRTLLIFSFAQMIIMVVAIASISHFMDNAAYSLPDMKKDRFKNSGFYGRQEGFIFAAVCGLIISFLSWLIAFARAYNNLACASCMLGLHLFSVVLLMVLGSLLAKTTVAYHDSFICERKNALGKDTHCYQLSIGLVCGFVAIPLFLTSGFIFYTLTFHDAEDFEVLDNEVN